MHLADHPARRRLSAALDNLVVTFHGMTAHPDEHNCECHWGSLEELSLLKTPDVELEPDLLRRTWRAIDWTDHAAVLRRILPVRHGPGRRSRGTPVRTGRGRALLRPRPLAAVA
jgi:hypothetical protein